MQRNAISHLKAWLKQSHRKPLVIRGARQVGKSTLVRIFAEEAGLELIELNVEKIRLRTLHQEQPNIADIISEIESLKNLTLSSNTLIFFDEIQQQPKLFPLLRYFYEDYPKIPVIAAGSLLEFLLEKHEFSMPVGRIEYFHLSPMTFFEFLTALGKTQLIKQVRETAPFVKNHLFDQLTEWLKIYFFVGGMPEAVKVFVESKNPRDVRRIQRSIIQTYKDDFLKYSSKAVLPKLDQIFERLPQIIGKKVKYSEISREYQAREIRNALRLLQQARILTFCYHTNASGLPLKAQQDISVFKMYFLDIGLMNYMQEVSWESIQEYTDDSLITKGTIAEQFAAQHLAYISNGIEEPGLFYWLRDKKNENAEIDFIVSLENKIMPIEIKAGRSGKLKSLVQFVEQKKTKEAYRFDLKDRTESELSINEKVSYKLTSPAGNKNIQFKLHNVHLALIELIKDFKVR